jgi:putative DNA primase/helicase
MTPERNGRDAPASEAEGNNTGRSLVRGTLRYDRGGGEMNVCAETIARAFSLRRAGRDYTGKCPNCGYPSGLTVTQRDGATLLYCHAGGCSQAELWGALERAGLPVRASRREAVERKRPSNHWPGRPPRAGEPSIRNTQPPPAPKDRCKGEAPPFAIWRRSRPAEGTPVETYLREARGYTGPIPAVLRFAACRHPSDPGRWHALLLAAVLHCGRMVAVHRTFLRQDGRGKADLEPDKMTLGPCKGGAVPLAPAEPVLAVAEGIETGLSFMLATAVPTWAALSAGGIRNLVLPEIVREVVIAVDPDPVGLIAAREAARRWLAQGRSVCIARPPLKSDFNDLLRYPS